MKILINLSNLRVGGGIQVARSFLDEIVNHTSDNLFVVVIPNAFKKYSYDCGLKSRGVIVHYYSIRPALSKVLFGHDLFLDRLMREYSCEKAFTLFGPSYWRPKVPHLVGFARTQYIFKDSPFFKGLSVQSRFYLKLREFVHMYDFKYNCTELVTENPVVSFIVAERLRKKVHTVDNTYHQIFDQSHKWTEVFKRTNDNCIYLLTVACNYPHKNLSVIPLVVKELLKRNIHYFRFVLTIKKGDIESNDICDEYIHYLGSVEIENCPMLYSSCDYVFLPTLLESFSASYAEAMIMEKPIITSDLPFAKGICGSAALYVNTLKPGEIVDNLIELNADSTKKEDLIFNGLKRVREFNSAKSRVVRYLNIIHSMK